jgi:hypothetical protein
VGFVAGALLLGEFLGSLYRAWNDVRLAPVAGLLRGYQLYYLPGEGPILSFDKGPLTALSYLPAVVWPRPDVAVLVGFLITVTLFFVPAFIWLRMAAGEERHLLAAFFLVFFFYSLSEPALAGPAFWIHADAPALGFGAMACALLYDPERRRRTGVQLASAACAVMALGAKQIALPLALGLLLYLAAADGLGAAWRYARWLAAVAVAAFVGILLLVDLDAMLFNTLTLHASHPWQWGGGAPALAIVFGQLMRVALPSLAVLGTALLLGWRRDLRHFLRDNPWTLPALIGLLSLPLALLGRVKVGGDTNNFAYSIYYWSLAALLALLHAARGEGLLRGGALGKPIKAMAVMVSVLLALAAAPALRTLPPLVAGIRQNPESIAFAAARQAPAEIYFPFHPLVSLMAEGKAYHTSYGIYDLALANRPLSAEAFYAHLPASMRWVALRDPNDYSLQYLDGYTDRTSLRQLPGWIVFAEGN